MNHILDLIRILVILWTFGMGVACYLVMTLSLIAIWRTGSITLYELSPAIINLEVFWAVSGFPIFIWLILKAIKEDVNR